MIPVSVRFAALCGLTLSLPGALAGFDSGASTNIAIYWGQNSVNRVGGQQRLAAYCSNTPFNIIPLAFMNSIVNPTEVNFANAGDNCTTFPGTQLLSCPQLEEDIQICQSLGKSILLSIGGATYTEGGFASSAAATTWADNVWAMFGPAPSAANPSVLRPFGNAVVDGFDMDLESTTSNMIPFVAELRAKMDAATASTGRKYLLSAAPQCPFPDAAVGSVLNAVAFDFVGIQFYNNYCGTQSYVAGASGPGNFNFDTWDNWAKTTSANKHINLLLGVPGSATAAGSGYVSGTQLSEVIEYSKTFSSFGGVMIWDMSQVYANTGFLASVVSALGSTVITPPPSTTSAPASATSTTAKPTTLTTVTRTSTSTSSGASPTGSLVPQWGQCGGEGYTGSTQCAPPYKCVSGGVWWSQCE